MGSRSFLKRLPRWGKFILHSAIARSTRLTAEWLPRWGQSKNYPIVASVGCTRFQLSGCLGGGSCLGGLPRWGRGYLCMYSLRQSDTLNSFRQYDTMKKYLYVLNFAPLF